MQIAINPQSAEKVPIILKLSQNNKNKRTPQKEEENQPDDLPNPLLYKITIEIFRNKQDKLNYKFRILENKEAEDFGYHFGLSDTQNVKNENFENKFKSEANLDFKNNARDGFRSRNYFFTKQNFANKEREMFLYDAKKRHMDYEKQMFFKNSKMGNREFGNPIHRELLGKKNEGMEFGFFYFLKAFICPCFAWISRKIFVKNFNLIF
jgi:hypothetical protein